MALSASVSPEQTVPAIAAEMWPDMVPNYGITIIAGLTPEGGETLHIVSSTNTPPWTLMGMLKCVMDDLEQQWSIYQSLVGDDDDGEA